MRQSETVSQQLTLFKGVSKIGVIMHTYHEVTEDVLIEVVPEYSASHSFPENEEYVFSYNVKITNQSLKTIQLLHRRWIIVDGFGQVEEVEGPGVVGEQPTLKPNESYDYVSFCPLPTPTGNMRGTYEMQDESGHSFRVNIPVFFLRTELH